MSEIYFYHLTASPLVQTLSQIIEKSLQNNWRVLVKSGDATQIARLNDNLWGGNTGTFIPHGVAGGQYDADQPVLFSGDGNNTNNADVLMLVYGGAVTAADIKQYQRVSLLFNGNDNDALDAARHVWKDLTTQGISAKYWSQASGQWKMEAQKN